LRTGIASELPQRFPLQVIGPSGDLSCETVLSLNFDHPMTRWPDDPIIPRAGTCPIAGSAAELFNTIGEKFVEKRELTLVTFY
jgi:hypothetical protein